MCSEVTLPLVSAWRMYETMGFWETAPTDGEPAVFRDYAGIWRAAEKIVYSRTLQTPSSAKTRIEREFDPDAVRQLKLSSTADLSIGGGDLAGQGSAPGLSMSSISSCARSW